MRIFGYEPAVILYALNAGVALLVSFGLPLDQEQTVAITVIATALFTIWAAVITRPVVVSTITAAAASLLAAVGAFGFELSGDQQGAAVAALSAFLALMLRPNVSPAPVAERPLRRVE